MRELYFASLLLSAGTCIALALQAAALAVQTRNRQYLRLFSLSISEALYCGLAYRYMGSEDGPSAAPWGQAICMLVPCLTYLFGQLCLGVVSAPRVLHAFQQLHLGVVAVFGALAVSDLLFWPGLVFEREVAHAAGSVHTPLGITPLGAGPMAFAMLALSLFMVHAVRSYREREDLLPIVCGCLAFVLCSLLDLATLLDLRDGLLFSHFGFLGLVLGSFRFLTRRFQRALFELKETVQVLEDQRRKLLLSPTLVQKQRLDGLGSLVAAMAHEINNPIQGILNYSSLLRLSLKEDPGAREYLDKLDAEGERVARIARGLLRFGRADEAESQLADLGEIVRATLALTQNAVRQEGILLSVSVAKELPVLRCRPYQLQQVLLNLINNARDALAARCPTRTEEKSIQIVVNTETRDGRPWLTVAVDDNGDGVAPEVAAQIFDPFFTTKSSTGGTGLGLSISHGIAEAHGGNLRLVHSRRTGSTFQVDLPCAMDEERLLGQVSA
ncbi:MAG: HAMP domain-containing sensor histidine kinase [Myxococcales bacterium]